MDGIELQRRLRASKVAVPVIVITGHGDVALAVEAMKAGAVDFIEKPFDDEVLVGAIRSALARRAEDAKGEARAAEIQRSAAAPVVARTGGDGRSGRRQAEQDHRPRSWHQPPNGRGLPRQPHDQDAGRQPFRPRPHGASRSGTGLNRHGAASFALDQVPGAGGRLKMLGCQTSMGLSSSSTTTPPSAVRSSSHSRSKASGSASMPGRRRCWPTSICRAAAVSSSTTACPSWTACN